MKKLILLLLFLLSISFSEVYSQTGWNLLHTFDEDINTIYFKNSSDGFAAAGSGKIYKTIDGGITWDSLFTSSQFISKFIFVSQDTGFAIGGKGCFFKTTDGGNNWTQKNINTTENLASITCPTNKIIFTCSSTNYVFKSTDGGENWTITQTPAYILYDIAFCSDSIGFGVGLYGSAIKTTDGGTSWTSLQILPLSMFSIKFINENVGYIVGGNEVAKTTDSGNTWTVVYSNPESLQLYSMSAYGENTVWVTATSKILKTTNGGNSWAEQTYSPYEYLVRINCIDSMTCYALGTRNLYKTIDGGNGVTGINNQNKIGIDFNLSQNYPNPFNPTTTITYQLPKAGLVELKVYDILGREVTSLVSKYENAGSHTIQFNGNNLPSSVYLYKINAGEYSASRKMILLK